MPPRSIKIIRLLGRSFALFLIVLFAAACGGGDSKETPAPGESDPTFSMPLPKGLWAPLPDSDLVMTARAVIDPGTAGERMVDLSVDLSTNRVTGVIEGVPAGPHTVEIRYFINQVQVAAVTLSVDVVPGQNNPVEIAPAAIRYIEAVSDALFVADAADRSIKIFDQYSNLKGGVVQAVPTRTLQGESSGIVGPSSGSLFVDSIGGGLYFADAQANSVRIWNAAAVDGNVPPDRVLEGGATELLQPSGIAFDPFRNRLYVVNGLGKILIWKDVASGDVPPTAVVSGAATMLSAGDHPIYLDVKANTLYVANGSQILVFEKLGSLTGEQEAAPARIIEIAGGLSQAGVAGDPFRDLLFVSSRDPDGKIYQVTGASAASAQIAPAATLAGAETGLNQASSVALAGNVLMALNQGGSQVRVWHHADQKKDDASPTQIIEIGSSALPTALFYVATQNNAQADTRLNVQKSGNGGITSDLPGINCGTTCSTLFPAGETITLTAIPAEDSHFAGWSDCDSVAETSCTVLMTAEKTVSAAFAIKPVLTVTKPGTGTGIVTSSPAGIQCGSDCSEPYLPGTQVTLTAAADASSDFTGWSDDCAGAGSCVVTMDAAKSVAATFALKPFTLAVSKAGTGRGKVTSNPTGIDCGTGPNPDCNESYMPGTTVTLTAAASSDSNFTGWSGCNSSSGTSCTVTVNTAKTVTATFTLKPVLTVAKSGSGTGTVTGTGINCGLDCTESYNNSTTQVTLTATPTADSDFISWSGCNSTNGASCTVTMNAAKTVTATFNLEPALTVEKAGTGTGTVTSNPAGINCGTDCSARFDVNTSVVLTAAPDTTSNFGSWSGCDSATGTSCTVNMTAVKSVTATFTLKTFTLTVNRTGNGTVTSNPPGIDCGADCSQSFDINTSVTLTATPDADSNLTNWIGCDSTSGNTCTVSLSGDKTVTVTFTLKTFPLGVSISGSGGGTVSSSPGGINCKPNCQADYNFGTVVTLTATPDATSIFFSWSGCDTSAGASCTVTMEAAKSVTVNFAVNTFTLTVATSGTGTVTSSPIGINCGADCSEIYVVNTVVTLTATPASGFVFDGWSGACSGLVQCDVSMNADQSVTANFIQVFTLTVSIDSSGTGGGRITGPAGIDGTGILCGTGSGETDCTEVYRVNTNVSLNAEPELLLPPSRFSGWGGDCAITTETTCVLTMNSHKFATARFDLPP